MEFNRFSFVYYIQKVQNIKLFKMNVVSYANNQNIKTSDGNTYVFVKKIEIQYKRPTLFSGPRVELERFHSLTPFFDKNQYIELIGKLDRVLKMAYIPIWLWLILFFLSLGLLGWIVIPIQKKRTYKAGKSLIKIVNELNQELLKKNEPGKLLLFEIPFPSKNKVILHACFYKKC